MPYSLSTSGGVDFKKGQVFLMTLSLGLLILMCLIWVLKGLNILGKKEGCLNVLTEPLVIQAGRLTFAMN